MITAKDMNNMRLTLLLLPLLGLLSGAVHAQENWRLEKEADGIQVYSRVVDGWSIRETRSSARLDARLGSLVAVLNDVNALRELNGFVKEARVLSSRDAAHYDFYSLVDLPWPMSDRDSVSRHSVEQDARTLTVTIRDEALSGQLPENKDLIRIPRSHQQWTLTPGTDGKVTVELRLLNDPGGSLPASFINASLVSTPMNSISKLGALARQAPYRDAKPAFIREAP